MFIFKNILIWPWTTWQFSDRQPRFFWTTTYLIYNGIINWLIFRTVRQNQSISRSQIQYVYTNLTVLQPTIVSLVSIWCMFHCFILGLTVTDNDIWTECNIWILEWKSHSLILSGFRKFTTLDCNSIQTIMMRVYF